MRKLLATLTTGTIRVVGEVVGAVLVGAGVPLLWVWIGSMIQGARGATDVEFSTALAMIVGIVFTYGAILYFAAWLQGRSDETRPPPVRYPWNRSMRDEPYRPGTKKLSPIEAAFVIAAVAATIAMMIWFFAYAGSPLPN
jgi:hypothetical protein